MRAAPWPCQPECRKGDDVDRDEGGGDVGGGEEVGNGERFGALSRLDLQCARLAQLRVQGPRRELEPVGPSQRTSFDEGAREISRVGQRLRQGRIVPDQIGSGPPRVTAVAEG